jgi:hypothetical protein
VNTPPFSDRELAHDIKRALLAVATAHGNGRRSFWALNHAIGIAEDLTSVLDFVDHSEAIGYCQDLDRAVAEVLARSSTLPGDPTIDNLTTVAFKIGELRDILGTLPANEDDGGCRLGKDAAWSARRLVQIATRLLPGRDRARYAEEFRSELWDLAGAGRRQQILYAARQLLRAAHLRIELKAPHRSKAPS